MNSPLPLLSLFVLLVGGAAAALPEPPCPAPQVQQTAAPLTPEERELFASLIESPESLADEHTRSTSYAQGDEYVQRIARRSPDGKLLTVLTRRATIGKAGFRYEKEIRHCAGPFLFEDEAAEPRTAPPDATEEGVEYVRTEQRTNREEVDYRPAHLFELSPDGKHAVASTVRNSGATSYVFGIFTREGGAWVEEPTAPSFGTRWCEPDYKVTDEGVLGLVIDEALELVIPVFLPYEGASEECVWVRSWRDSRDTPLVEAAREGQVEVVRALLTSPQVDPGAVDCRGDDATMVTDNPEIIAMVREAQGADYDRLAALDAAVDYWRSAHEGRTDTGDNGFPISYINTLHERKAAHLEALPQPPRRLSPDGRHAVCARVVRGATGQTSYAFTIYTRRGAAWDQEAQQPAISSAVCTPGYRLTDEGIECLFADADMGHLITLLIPYRSEQAVEHHYRAEPFLHPTPLVEAAERGDSALVRALLASDRTDPGAVDCYGRDATMVTEDAEIISLIRAAQGAGYNRRTALEAALHLWQQVAEGKRPAPCRRTAAAALEDLRRALSSLPE